MRFSHSHNASCIMPTVPSRWKYRRLGFPSTHRAWCRCAHSHPLKSEQSRTLTHNPASPHPIRLQQPLRRHARFVSMSAGHCAQNTGLRPLRGNLAHRRASGTGRIASPASATFPSADLETTKKKSLKQLLLSISEAVLQGCNSGSEAVSWSSLGSLTTPLQVTQLPSPHLRCAPCCRFSSNRAQLSRMLRFWGRCHFGDVI